MVWCRWNLLLHRWIAHVDHWGIRCFVRRLLDTRLLALVMVECFCSWWLLISCSYRMTGCIRWKSGLVWGMRPDLLLVDMFWWVLLLLLGNWLVYWSQLMIHCSHHSLLWVLLGKLLLKL